jgi:hypothetical protein
LHNSYIAGQNAFGGGPTAATVGGRGMKVDYVAVYKK